MAETKTVKVKMLVSAPTKDDFLVGGGVYELDAKLAETLIKNKVAVKVK